MLREGGGVLFTYPTDDAEIGDTAGTCNGNEKERKLTSSVTLDLFSQFELFAAVDFCPCSHGHRTDFALLKTEEAV